MIIGTRGSALALKQAEIAVKELGLNNFELKIIKTKGDKTKKPLQNLGQGVFTKELDNALMNNEIDLAVHSLKDIPVENFPEELEIASIPKRDDPRDCLLGNLRENSVIGADSIRRQYELRSLCKGMNPKFKSLRGNIETRIRKLRNKEYDAIIIAKAALDRLKLTNLIDIVFSIKEMVPSAGQGAVAVVKRKNESFLFLKKGMLYDCCILEREFIKNLGGCKKPVGAYCYHKDGNFHLTGLAYKNNIRLLSNFSGTKEEITDKIKKWKETYIL